MTTKIVLLSLLLFGAGLAIGQQVVPTVSNPPTLTPIDPTSTMAMVAAAQSNSDKQWNWTIDNITRVGKKLDDISAEEAIEIGETNNIKNDITGIKTQLASLPQTTWNNCTRAIPLNYVVHVSIPWLSGATVFPDILLSSGSSTAAKLRFDKAGSRYDYSVCVPATGNYNFRIRASISITASGNYSLHVESNGVGLGSLQIPTATTGWTTSSMPIVFQNTGPQIITLVVDSKGTGEFAGDWFELIKQ